LKDPRPQMKNRESRGSAAVSVLHFTSVRLEETRAALNRSNFYKFAITDNCNSSAHDIRLITGKLLLSSNEKDRPNILEKIETIEANL